MREICFKSFGIIRLKLFQAIQCFKHMIFETELLKIVLNVWIYTYQNLSHKQDVLFLDTAILFIPYMGVLMA